MADSIWKKEISFKRKQKTKESSPATPAYEPQPLAEPLSAPAPEPGIQSQAAQLLAPAVQPLTPPQAREPLVPSAPPPARKVERAPQAESTSVWKKEISFGRKPKAKLPERAVEPQAAQLEPLSALIATAPAKPAKGRKAKQEAKAAAKAKTESASVWKKEISFGRKPKATEPAQVMPAFEPQPTAEPRAEQAPAPTTPQQLLPPQAHDRVAPELPSAPEEPAEARKAEQATKAPKPESTSVWKKEISFGRKPKAQEPARATAQPEPQAGTPLPQQAPQPLAPLIAGKPATGRKAKQAAKAEQKQAPKPQSTSVWKKEISFGRKPKRSAAAPLRREPQRVAPQYAPEEAPSGLTLPPVSLPMSNAPLAGRPVVELLGNVAVPPGQTLPMPEAPAEAPAQVQAAPAQKLSRKERKRAEEEAKAAAKKAAQEAKRAGKGQGDGGYKRHKKLVGLKIGASHLAAAHIQNNGHVRLLGVAEADLNPGIVVGGELRDPDELAVALKAFFRKNRLPKGNVRLGVSNNRIGVRIFEIAGIEDPKQLANAIRFRAQDALPIPLDEAVLDYRILSDEVKEDGTHVRRVLLVVAHKGLVERYAAACRKAGLKLVGIDLEAFALLRALTPPGAAVGAGDDAGLVVVSIGHERSTLAVSDGRICEFTRVLEWGGAELDTAIGRALELTPQEAELVKRSISMQDDAPPPPGIDPDVIARIRAAIRDELQAFARELVASLRFYQDQPGSLGIAEVVITGGTANLDGLASTLERLVGVRVRVGDPSIRVKAPRKLRKLQLAGSLTAAIGLGIDD